MVESVTKELCSGKEDNTDDGQLSQEQQLNIHQPTEKNRKYYF